MSKFQPGDRVRVKDTIGTNMVGVVTDNHASVVQWDAGFRSAVRDEQLERVSDSWPDEIPIEINVVAVYGPGRGVVDVRGLPLENLTGKFKLIRVG